MARSINLCIFFLESVSAAGDFWIRFRLDSLSDKRQWDLGRNGTHGNSPPFPQCQMRRSVSENVACMHGILLINDTIWCAVVNKQKAESRKGSVRTLWCGAGETRPRVSERSLHLQGLHVMSRFTENCRSNIFVLSNRTKYLRKMLVSNKIVFGHPVDRSIHGCHHIKLHTKHRCTVNARWPLCPIARITKLWEEIR